MVSSEILDVVSALNSRKSIRAFTQQPVSPALIEEILTLAARSPSGANIQPWKVTVITGEALKKLGEELVSLSLSGEKPSREYHYYPREWREPYLGRRRKVGWDLYHSVGIERGDKEKMARQQARNFCFFDAPVGLLLTLDRDMETGSWLDMGMFMQSIMIAARGFGLDTCTQAAFTDYWQHVVRILDIPSDQQLICGMALGYRDEKAPENNFSTEREPVSSFTRFINSLGD